MAGFVMMGLIFVLIVYISIAKKKKRAVGISMVLIGLFYLYVSYSCGPNSADVKVMKPMAQKISEYIVKNGIPESLKDIPDLPYGLEGCERSVVFIKRMIAKDIKVNNSKNATYMVVKEKCKYIYKARIYEVRSYREKGFSLYKYDNITLRIYQYDSKTGVEYDLEYDTNYKKWKMKYSLENNYKSIRIYNNKTSGICNPMRQ
jgi:hypothetical protein